MFALKIGASDPGETRGLAHRVRFGSTQPDELLGVRVTKPAPTSISEWQQAERPKGGGTCLNKEHNEVRGSGQSDGANEWPDEQPALGQNTLLRGRNRGVPSCPPFPMSL